MKNKMELIDKAAVVAEIKMIISKLRKSCNPNPFGTLQECLTDAEIEALHLILDYINTLEVKFIESKEVDFERELSKYVSNGIHRFFPNVDDDYCKMDSVIWQDYVIETAKHFFELGLKTKKGEKI